VKAVNISRKHSPYHKDVWGSALSTDQEMTPVTNAKDAHAQYFLVKDEFRLSDLRPSAQCSCSIQATRTAWCSQSSSTSRTVCSRPVLGPIASRPPRCSRHEYYYLAWVISWSLAGRYISTHFKLQHRRRWIFRFTLRLPNPYALTGEMGWLRTRPRSCGNCIRQQSSPIPWSSSP
jgi:hypothetical protein